MSCTVEYMFKYGTRAYTENSMFAPFPTIDQAISFIEGMKMLFSDSIEWMFIHIKTA